MKIIPGCPLLTLLPAIALAGALAGAEVRADDGDGHYRVTVTNLTRGQSFTPILVASHRWGVRLFELGMPASAELAMLAEEGDTGPLAALLGADPRVLDVEVIPGLLAPGETRSVMVAARGSFNRLSVASMLIPTNDAFFALNAVPGPEYGHKASHTSVAYDAGSERNDETCMYIPGPSFAECGGPGGGGAASGGEEGHVHIHAGIHGIGDLNAAGRDWRNPVALIRIHKVD
jgi:hypothetical protein